MRYLSLPFLLGFVLAAPAEDYVPAPEKAGHWAWKTPAPLAPPPPRTKASIHNPIDAFIVAKLEEAGLAPARPASREQLLRRVTFDLIGLPPTPAEIDAFVKDAAPG